MRAGNALVLSGLLLLAGCTSGGPGRADEPTVSYATPDRVQFADGTGVEIDAGLGDAAPLAAVETDSAPLLMLSDRLVDVSEGHAEDVLEFEPPIVGGEVAPSSRGTAMTAVTWPLGDLPERTRVLWVESGDVEVLLDAPGNFPLVGVLEEGVLLRSSLGTSPLSVLGWDGSMVGLGVEAADALLVPDTGLVVLRTSEEAPLRVLDIESGAEQTVDGLPAGAGFTQLVASPTSSEVVAVVDSAGEGGDGAVALWHLRTDPLAARQVVPLERSDVVAGFSDDGEWVVLVTDGERFGTDVAAVRLEDGETVPLELPEDGTPLGWSRTVLTLQPLRPAQ